MWTLALVLSETCFAASAPDAPAKDTPEAAAELDAFLADVVSRVPAEQQKVFESLVAQLPPNAAPGDPLRARRILVAVLNRGSGIPKGASVAQRVAIQDAADRALCLAVPEKSVPIILEAATRGTQRGRMRAFNLIGTVAARTKRGDLFRDALPSLREAIVADDKLLRNAARYALMAMGEDGVMGLLEMLHSSQASDMFPIGNIAEYADIVLPVLNDALKKSDPTRQRNAAILLQSIASEGEETVPLLLPLLGSQDAETRAAAARTLGLYGSAARAAVPRLLELLAADDPAVWLPAVESLGRIGIEADQLDRLWRGVVHIEAKGNNYNWFYAFGRAAASPGRAAVPGLTKALAHPDPRVRRAAACACAYLGPVAGPAARPLMATTSDNDRETASGAYWALEGLGSTAAVVIEPLMARLEQSQWSPTRGSWERFEAPGADQLAAIGPAAVPALCKGLTGNSDAVQAGSARALGQMDAVEARSAIPDLLKLFDESKNEKVQIVALGALIQLAADPKELAPRLHPLVGAGEAGTPIAAPRNEPRHGSLAAIATRYLRERNSQKPPAPQRGMLRHRYPFDPADFSWGQTSAGLQVGVSLPPIIYGSQKNEPDVRRLLVAIRNVGDRPVVLPLDASHPAGLDVRLTEEPDVLSPHASGFHSSPDLHELRPGQVILTRPAITLRLAYGRRTAAGRWTPFVGKDKDYHVTVTLRGLNNPDPPHLPCYASAAVRKECWQGVAASGTIATRLDNTYVQY